MIPPSSSRRASVALFTLAAAWACSGSDDTGLFSAQPGWAAFALAGIDRDVSSLEYSVTNAAGEVLVAEDLRPDPGQAIGFVIDLPAGNGYTVALTARTTDGQSCSGASPFDVQSRRRVEVSVELVCDGDVGHASVTGTLVPAPACPSVAIATADTPLELGASLVLETSVEGSLAASPVWTASGGELATEGGVPRFTCTEPGTVRIDLAVNDGECNTTDSVDVTCSATVPVSACDGLGSTCHLVDATSDAAHACHELGHGGDEAACAEGRAGCVDTCGSAICSELASLCHEVDPGNGPIHECHELGHGADAAACFARGPECFDLCTKAHFEPVTINFAARVGDAAFACGSSYVDVGSSGVTAQPRDFRFFVHDVRLVGADGGEVPVEIDERAPYQALGTALLDFENATGGCLSGDATTNTTITGKAPPGEYTGVAFRIGVPESLNHANPAAQPVPLAAGNMAWGWLSGYRFLRAELGAEGGGGGVLHLGSAACTGDPALGSVSCARPNRAAVTLTGFNATTDTIVADIAAIFVGTDLGVESLCHSAGAACEGMFQSLGVALGTGQSSGTQSVFRVAQ
jgi:uncharacterized repeat protein (TIGR04052 family)